jgi:hypothetical protein
MAEYLGETPATTAAAPEEEEEEVFTVESLINELQSEEADGRYRELHGRYALDAINYYRKQASGRYKHLNPALSAPGKRFEVRVGPATVESVKLANGYTNIIETPHGIYVQFSECHLNHAIDIVPFRGNRMSSTFGWKVFNVCARDRGVLIELSVLYFASFLPEKETKKKTKKKNPTTTLSSKRSLKDFFEPLSRKKRRKTPNDDKEEEGIVDIESDGEDSDSTENGEEEEEEEEEPSKVNKVLVGKQFPRGYYYIPITNVNIVEV